MFVNEPIKLHQRDVPALKLITSSSAPLSEEALQGFMWSFMGCLGIFGLNINKRRFTTLMNGINQS